MFRYVHECKVGRTGNVKIRGFVAKWSLAMVVLAIFCIAVCCLYGIGADGRDNMLDLIAGRPHPRLIRLDLEFGPSERDARRRVISLEDAGAINYINATRFGPRREISEYTNAAWWPIPATFVFADGRSYNAEVAVPNRRGYLWITYPVNPWSFDTLDDKRHLLDLDLDDGKNVEKFFEGLGAYRDGFQPAKKKGIAVKATESGK
jgi:hypothetical protein